MLNYPEFVEAVSDAYQHLFDLVYLRSHLLTDLVVPDPEMRRKDKAWHLHQTLIDVIDELDPGPQAPPLSPAWRRYRLLAMRYLEGIDAQIVADQLAISRRHFYRERDAAIEAVSEILWDRHVEKQRTLPPAPGLPSAQPADAPAPASGRQEASDRLQLLRSETAHLIQSHAGTRPLDVLNGVLELLKDMAAQHHIVLEPPHVPAPPSVLPDVAVDPNILRHLLVTVVGYLIKRTRHARICFQIAETKITDQNVQRSSLRLEKAAVEIRIQVIPPPPQTTDTAQEADTAQEVATLQELATVGHIEIATLTEEGHFAGFVLGLPLEQKHKVLIIDDNADALELFQRFLVSHRYQVFTAQSANTGQELAVRIMPHVIILDLMMPDRDGWDLLQTLRNHPTTQELPLVVCSILRQRDLALALGAAAFLAKPFTEESLLSVLDAVVQPPRQHLPESSQLPGR